MGAEARALGHGGIRLVAAAAGAAEVTVLLGARELESGEEPLGRARREGGGRKKLTETDPGLVPALLALVEPRSGATRNRRCGGRARGSGTWPAS